MVSGRIAAANAEEGSITTAFSAYCAENSISDNTTVTWTSAQLATNLAPYISGSLKYDYTITAGLLAGVDGASSKALAAGIKWDAGTSQWVRN